MICFVVGIILQLRVGRNKISSTFYGASCKELRLLAAIFDQSTDAYVIQISIGLPITQHSESIDTVSEISVRSLWNILRRGVTSTNSYLNNIYWRG